MDDHFYQQYPSHRIHSQQVTDSGNKKSCKKYSKWTFIIHRGLFDSQSLIGLES